MTEPVVHGNETFGVCDERFAAVGAAFDALLSEGVELGASFAVVHDDEVVVDLWGGYSDIGRRHRWERDTIVMVSSTAKVVASIAGLMLIDRDLIALNEPIATYWPEFAAAGKSEITVRQIFCHETGVPGFGDSLPSETIMGDWDACVAHLAAEPPWWEPGTKSGYHSMSYGYLLGELVRRTTGVPYAEFIQSELLGPLDADFSIGVPEADRGRVADLESLDTRVYPLGPTSFAARSEGGIDTYVHGPVPQAWLTGCNPSGLGFSNARAVAQVGAVLANSGTSRGTRFMSADTAALTRQEQRYEHDLVMEAPVRWGLGFALASEEVPLPFPRSIHWGGFGGSTFVAEPDSRTTWCYAPSRFVIDREGDSRGTTLGAATVHSILGLG